jgi:hypothetical protein
MSAKCFVLLHILSAIVQAKFPDGVRLVQNLQQLESIADEAADRTPLVFTFLADIDGAAADTLAKVVGSNSPVTDAVLFAVTNAEIVCEQFWGNEERQDPNYDGLSCIESISPSRTLILSTWDEQRYEAPAISMEHPGMLYQFIRDFSWPLVQFFPDAPAPNDTNWQQRLTTLKHGYSNFLLVFTETGKMYEETLPEMLAVPAAVFQGQVAVVQVSVAKTKSSMPALVRTMAEELRVTEELPAVRVVSIDPDNNFKTVKRFRLAEAKENGFLMSRKVRHPVTGPPEIEAFLRGFFAEELVTLEETEQGIKHRISYDSEEGGGEEEEGEGGGLTEEGEEEGVGEGAGREGGGGGGEEGEERTMDHMEL